MLVFQCHTAISEGKNKLADVVPLFVFLALCQKPQGSNKKIPQTDFLKRPEKQRVTQQTFPLTGFLD